jgi:hypothetical protein
MAYPQSNRRRAAQRVAALLIASGVIGVGTASADPRRPAIDPGLDCTLYPVVSGDTLSAIARRNGLTLGDIIARNPHLTNPSLIYPQDQVVIRCTPKPDVRPAPSSTEPPTTTAAPQPAPEMQRVEKPAIVIDWPGFNDFIPGEQIVDGVASQSLILRALWDAGARGNQLIALAAVTEMESNRRINAEGDHELRDATWDLSLTPWQIRSAKNQKGKGTARDVDALRADPIGHGAAAAVEIYDAALAAGRDPVSPWTAHLKGHDRSFLEPYRLLATALGML